MKIEIWDKMIDMMCKVPKIAYELIVGKNNDGIYFNT